MGQSEEITYGVLSFTVGGTLLFYGLYFVLQNVNKSNINQELFSWFFVIPIGLLAFFLLGVGLALIIKAGRS